MRAVFTDDARLAPTLGFFRPLLQPGAHLREGDLVGTLERLGRREPVTAPPGSRGQVLVPTSGYVQYGDGLYTLGALELDANEGEVHRDTEGMEAVTTPMAGAVYLHPSPGEPAFVRAGESVARNATVALVEVMKTFTPLKAPRAGVVRRIEVRDGDAVEANSVVLWLADAAE